MFDPYIPVDPYGTPGTKARWAAHRVVLLRRMTRRREKPLRFEIMRLDDVDGTAVDSTVVDAASVNRIVQQAAAIGQRLWIRPAETTAS
ncbi:hypothetical protein GCM10010103_22090 [Streptomyces paradoxus]